MPRAISTCVSLIIVTKSAHCTKFAIRNAKTNSAMYANASSFSWMWIVQLFMEAHVISFFFMDIGRIVMGLFIMGIPCLFSICLAMVLLKRELRKAQWTPTLRESTRKTA